VSYPSFEQAAAVVDKFLALLEARGLRLQQGGAAESEALAMIDLLEMWKKPATRPSDPRNVVRAAMGFVDLAGKVVSVAGHSNFDELWPHLEMLNTTTVLQNAMSPVTDDAANKVIELYMACLAMGFSSNVALDHPTKSKGDNPDVMFDFRGQRWALALKTLHSTKARTIYDNIKKGADQIEASEAKYGLVVVNLKNVIDYDALWPSANIPLPEVEVIDRLQEQIRGIIAGLHEIPSTDWIAALGPERKAKPPVLYVAQAASSAIPQHGVGNALYMPVKAVVVDLCPEGDPVGAMKLARTLHDAMQQFV